MCALILGLVSVLVWGTEATGCATASESDDSTTDAGHADATTDGTQSDAMQCPTGHTGPTCQMCANGFHACGTNCEQNHANVPDAGCTEGCNSTPCPAPQNGTALCTSNGACNFACNTSFDETDAGACVCPAGQVICTGVCQQCCSDSDCSSLNEVCNSGTCSGCQPGYGDCNGNPTDGCETHLNTTSNCGACGHGCCGSICGCGFLGLGGQSCDVSGTSFACGC